MKKTLFTLSLFCIFITVTAKGQNSKFIDTSAPITTNKNMTSFKQNDQRISFKQVKILLKSDARASDLMDAAQKNRIWATILGGVGGYMIGYQIGNMLVGKKVNWAWMGAGAAVIGIGIPIDNNYKRNTRLAIETYNNGL